jgi:hypothetical protein
MYYEVRVLEGFLSADILWKYLYDYPRTLPTFAMLASCEL